jgi:HD-like signal output (HDOD) protein
MQQIDHEADFAEFLNKFKGQIRIAPLAMNIHVLMQALSDEELTPRQLASVLHHYPVITARLIALANSAWVSPAMPITNIEAACVRLGNFVIKGVSIAIAVASSFNTARCPSFDTIRFWVTSILVAEGAGLLAAKLPNRQDYPTDIEFTAQTGGILHNLGLLWLADNMATETASALKLVTENPLITINDALTQCIGIDYCQAGAWISKRWHIPEDLINVIQHHRDPIYLKQAAAPVLLVGGAAKMVSSVFHGFSEPSEFEGFDYLGISLAEQESVYKQLEKRLDSTRELARALFI